MLNKFFFLSKFEGYQHRSSIIISFFQTTELLKDQLKEKTEECNNLLKSNEKKDLENAKLCAELKKVRKVINFNFKQSFTNSLIKIRSGKKRLSVTNRKLKAH